MSSGAGDTTQLVPGYPIRTPWDHSLVDSSPRPIAASHVLHRLLVPRHPPSALDNLTTKMLASTMQISTNNQPQPHRRHPPADPTDTTPAAPADHRQFATQATPGNPNHHTPPTHGRRTASRALRRTTTVVLSGPNRVFTTEPAGHHTPVRPPPTGGRVLEDIAAQRPD
jgi:hypothetical protein